jgi:hypothetical protein
VSKESTAPAPKARAANSKTSSTEIAAAPPKPRGRGSRSGHVHRRNAGESGDEIVKALDEKERAEIIETTRKSAESGSVGKKARKGENEEVKEVAEAAREAPGGQEGMLPVEKGEWKMEDAVALAKYMRDQAEEEDEDYSALKCRKGPVCRKVCGQKLGP